MRFFKYKLSMDFGFAPNPFYGFCTLATCKFRIRKSAQVGEWIFGTGSVKLKCLSHLIYAMKVTEKISYNEYWFKKRFACKKPVMNGSLKKMYGDNIYYHDGSQWLQENSRHSKEDGSVNHETLSSDTKADAVLISSHFYYFGENYFKVPSVYEDGVCCTSRDFEYSKGKDIEKSKSFIKWLQSNHSPGYHGDPINFVKQFSKIKY